MTTHADALAAAAHLDALERDTPKLAALRDQHTQAAETIRRQVRDGTATFDDLVTAESRLAAASNLVEQHAQEVTQAQAQAEALSLQAARTEDAGRLQDLSADLAANLDRRHQLAGQFIQGLEDSLSALVVNAAARGQLAAEATVILNRLGERVPYEISQHAGQHAPGVVYDHLLQQLTGDALAEALRDTLRDGLRRVLDLIHDQVEVQA